MAEQEVSRRDLLALREVMVLRVQALQSELTKAERVLGGRLEGIDQLQSKIDRVQQLMASRDYVDTLNKTVEHRINGLETRAAYGLGYVAGVSAAVAVLISVLVPVIKAL